LTTAHRKLPVQEVRLEKGFREIPPEYHTISNKQVFAEFWEHARPQKKVFVVILLSVLLQGGVAGGSIYLLKHALDLFFDHTGMSTMLFLIGTLFLATVFKSTLEFIFDWKKTVAVARIHDKLLVRAFRDLLLNPFKYHVNEQDRMKYGWVLTDSMKFIEAFFGMFNSWGRQPFVLLSTITALWIISPMLTLIGVLLVPLAIPCVVYLKRKIKTFVEQRKLILGKIEEIVAETIRNIRIVKVFGMEERNVYKLRQTVDQQRNINLKNTFYIGLMSPLSELLGFIGLTVIIVAGSQKIIGDTFSNGTFFVFIMAFLNIYRPLKDISNGYMNHQLALDAGRRLIVLRQRAEMEKRNEGTVKLERFDCLTVDNLWFSYQDNPAHDSDYVLRHLSLTIRKSETVAIVGATGAGKSTLCDLICRLYLPGRGKIMFNTHPIETIAKDDFSRILALCSQETIVFNNSLFDEIKIARPEATRPEVEAAAQASGLSAYLNTIGRDLDTWIGDRGVQFSGGQRQMIAIARAMLGRPQLLIMDEAMSGLDVETSRSIWESIRKMLPETTILVISHNWDIIKNCRKVLVLKAGAIVKSMNVADIEDKEKFFRELHLQKRTADASSGSPN
jgi:ATP-binding cassette, subfamily B, bacterial MsbA